MKDDPEMPRLRMAPRTTADELVQRIEKEQRAAGLQREMSLEKSLAPFKVGSVPYLNAVPLTRGIEDEIIFSPPAQLAIMLREGQLDAALLSITEVLFSSEYDILDGVAIASLGEVFSVFLAHTVPLEKVRIVHYDPASLTSVNLLRVLLAERGLKPELLPLNAPPQECEAVLLIGNPAIEFRRASPKHEIWDLGAAWFEMTKLPFVYAVWALQRRKEMETLRRQLREAKDFGLDTLDYLIENRTDYDRAFRKDYLGWHIHYHLGADEKRGVAEFVRLLRKHSEREVFEPNYVV
ncbi:MAG: menaquinone biosynthesis protein [Limisphaerales bacterium]